MAELPISSVDAAIEIKKLIIEKGIESLTGKLIRRHLETEFNCSLSGYKSEIDKITLEKIEEVNREKTEEEPKSSDDTSEEESSSDTDDEVDDKEPKMSANQKRKAKEASSDDDDIASGVKRSRRSATKPKRANAKTEKKKKRKGNSGFTRVCILSDELANLLNKKYMRRHDVVKEMWAYFREKDLMDPKDRRRVLLDEPLQEIFGAKKSILAFGMMSGMKQHLIDVHTLESAARKKAEAEIKELFPENENANGSDDEDSDQKKSKKSKKIKSDGPRKETAFTKVCSLSNELVEVLGERHLRRCDIVKRMWAYFREHNLFDPNDRRWVILDEPLRNIYKGQKKIRAFGLMSGLKPHVEVATFVSDAERQKVEAKLDALKSEKTEYNDKLTNGNSAPKEEEEDTSNNDDDDDDDDGTKNGKEESESDDSSSSDSSSSDES